MGDAKKMHLVFICGGNNFLKLWSRILPGCQLFCPCSAYTEKKSIWPAKKVSAVSGREVKSITIKKVFLERPWKLCLWGLSTKMTSKLGELNVMASAGGWGSSGGRGSESCLTCLAAVES